MRGNFRWQVDEVLSSIKGIGQSKREVRRNSSLIGQNGRVVSDLIHSFKYEKEIRRTVFDLVYFSEERFGIKDIEMIDNDMVLIWFESKIFSGLSYGTMSTYISHLLKFRNALKEYLKVHYRRLDITTFDTNFLYQCRELCKNECIRLKSGNRAYVDIESILSKIKKRSRYKVILQYRYGLRALEAIHLKYGNFLPGSKIKFQGKGGYWLKKELKRSLYTRIRAEVMVGKYNIKYATYRNDLKKAVLESNQDWKGTHGLRYIYAQNQMRFYEKIGYNREKSKYFTSLDLGHQRPSITETYLR